MRIGTPICASLDEAKRSREMQDRDTHMLVGGYAHTAMPFARAGTGRWFGSHQNDTLYRKGSSNWVGLALSVVSTVGRRSKQEQLGVKCACGSAVPQNSGEEAG